MVNIFLECASFPLLLTLSILSDQISSLHQLLVQKPFRAGDMPAFWQKRFSRDGSPELKPWLSMPFPSLGVPEPSLSAWRCWELWELLLNAAEVAQERRLGDWVPSSLSCRPSAGCTVKEDWYFSGSDVCESILQSGILMSVVAIIEKWRQTL